MTRKRAGSRNDAARQRRRSKSKTKRLFQRVIKHALTRSEELTVSQWAPKHRILDESSNLEGKWSNDITPYLVDIMDAFNAPHIREIYFCKASQIGGTEALVNMLGYIITESPAPTLIVYPNDDLAKDICNDKLKPAFKLSPKIKEQFLENSSKELRLKFKNMVLYLRGSGSPSKLASKSIKYLFFDEIDKMGGASKKEASPYNLAMERVKTYKHQSKVFACSTPTLKTNYIWNLHENADEVLHYFVPCPHCNELIELKWKQIKYDEDDEGIMSNYERAKTSRYICQECGCIIEDKDKPKMLREGKWIATKKRGIGKPKSLGFWINSLYSIFLTWSDVAEEFLKSYQDPELLQNFVNSWLGECWEDTKLKTSEELVLERQTDIPEFVVPDWVKFLTGGVDVQESSLYWTIRGWGPYITSQNIAHGQALSFGDIEKVMNLSYKKENGEPLVVALSLIDSGYDADATYDFCASNSEWALPVKGSSNPMMSHYKLSKVNKADSKAYGMNLVLVDGDKYKDMIAGRMRKSNEQRGAWMVHAGCDQDYAEQVTAEHKVNIKNGSKTVQKWVLKTSHSDNHYLDTEVYAMGAADIMGVRSLHLEMEGQIQGRKEKAIPESTPEENWIQENESWI